MFARRFLAVLAAGVLTLGVPPVAAAVGTLDQAQEDHSGGLVALSPLSSYAAQTFTAGASGQLESVELYLSPSVYATTATVRIESIAGGIPTGAVLAAAAPHLVSTEGWTLFWFYDPVRVVAGTQYAIVLVAPTPLWYGPPWPWSVDLYSSGQAIVNGYVSPAPTADFAFRTFVTPTSACPQGPYGTAFPYCADTLERPADGVSTISLVFGSPSVVPTGVEAIGISLTGASFVGGTRTFEASPTMTYPRTQITLTGSPATITPSSQLWLASDFPGTATVTLVYSTGVTIYDSIQSFTFTAATINTPSTALSATHVYDAATGASPARGSDDSTLTWTAPTGAVTPLYLRTRVLDRNGNFIPSGVYVTWTIDGPAYFSTSGCPASQIGAGTAQLTTTQGPIGPVESCDLASTGATGVATITTTVTYLGVAYPLLDKQLAFVSTTPIDQVTQPVPAGGTATTSSGPLRAADPVATFVTSPTAGVVTIDEGAPPGPPPTGYGLLGQQVTIAAPPATPDDPLYLTFRLDASLLPPGLDPRDPTAVSGVAVFRNGQLVGDCAGPAGTASPDPCVRSRDTYWPSSGQLGVEIVILTSAASTWNFGLPVAIGGLEPPSVEGVLLPSESMTLTKTVHTPATPGVESVVVAMTSDCTAPIATSFEPATQTVVPGADAVFTETISAADTALGGTYSCRDWATIDGQPMTDGDGATIYETKTIDVPPAYVTGGGQIVEGTKRSAARVGFAGTVGSLLDGTLVGHWQVHFVNVAGSAYDGATFQSTSIASLAFATGNGMLQEPPAPPTVVYNFADFDAVGRLNGEDGWTVGVHMVDRGEPGVGHDSIRMTLTNPAGVQVYDTFTSGDFTGNDIYQKVPSRHTLDEGNLQIHPGSK